MFLYIFIIQMEVSCFLFYRVEIKFDDDGRRNQIQNLSSVQRIEKSK